MHTLSSHYCTLTTQSQRSKQIHYLPVSTFVIGENCDERGSCSFFTNDDFNTFQFRMNLPFQKQACFSMDLLQLPRTTLLVIAKGI